jgi:hypothetical protein
MTEQGFTRDVPQGAPRVAGEAFGLVAPLAGAPQNAAAIAQMLRQIEQNAAASTKLSKQAGAFKFPQDEALAAAQRNAAKPISEGGLGLAANNTPMDRAKAMGFESPVYHGTNADITLMNTAGKGKTSGSGAFVTDNPLVAETYFSGSGGGNVMPMLMKKENLMEVNARGRNWADISTNTLSPKVAGKRYPLEKLELDRNSATTTDELGAIANNLRLKGVDVKNVKDLGPNTHNFRAKEYLQEKYGIYPNDEWSNVSGKQFTEARDYVKKLYDKQKSNITAIQDPSMIRSRFAAFDPARRNEADLLGAADPRLLALLAAASGGAAYGSKDK